MLPGPMKDTLDSIQVMMTGSGTFDQAAYDLFISTFDEKLLRTQEQQWEGMAEYAQMGGDQSVGDYWPKCEVRFLKKCQDRTETTDLLINP